MFLGGSIAAAGGFEKPRRFADQMAERRDLLLQRDINSSCWLASFVCLKLKINLRTSIGVVR